MRAYITVWKEDDQVKYRFTGTQADQRSAQREALSEKHEVLRNEEVEVPLVKAELLDFLNDFNGQVMRGVPS